MDPTPAARTRRKPRDRYHHGDLRQALLQTTLRTIQKDGVEAVTLRGVGERLGVSRTALYRHFADKSALLQAVAGEGFRMLRDTTADAWEQGGRTLAAFEAMGLAYVRFAVVNPSHYRVMFGSHLDRAACDPGLLQEGGAAFQVLVEALVSLQQQGLVRRDDPLEMARYVWAIVHGIATLAIDGQLERQQADPEALTRYAIERIRTGIAAS